MVGQRMFTETQGTTMLGWQITHCDGHGCTTLGWQITKCEGHGFSTLGWQAMTTLGWQTTTCDAHGKPGYELQLWVEAGLPPVVALQAATLNAAKLLRADGRIGLVAPNRDANLLLVDGDPTRDITATERISMVVLKGERVRRVDLFDPAKNPLQ